MASSSQPKPMPLIVLAFSILPSIPTVNSTKTLPWTPACAAALGYFRFFCKKLANASFPPKNSGCCSAKRSVSSSLAFTPITSPLPGFAISSGGITNSVNTSPLTFSWPICAFSSISTVGGGISMTTCSSGNTSYSRERTVFTVGEGVSTTGGVMGVIFSGVILIVLASTMKAMSFSSVVFRRA